MFRPKNRYLHILYLWASVRSKRKVYSLIWFLKRKEWEIWPNGSTLSRMRIKWARGIGWSKDQYSWKIQCGGFRRSRAIGHLVDLPSCREKLSAGCSNRNSLDPHGVHEQKLAYAPKLHQMEAFDLPMVWGTLKWVSRIGGDAPCCFRDRVPTKTKISQFTNSRAQGRVTGVKVKSANKCKAAVYQMCHGFIVTVAV